jgi:hypothetical protein
MGNPLDGWEGIRLIDWDKKFSWNQLQKTSKASEVECEIDRRIS